MSSAEEKTRAADAERAGAVAESVLEAQINMGAFNSQPGSLNWVHWNLVLRQVYLAGVSDERNRIATNNTEDHA